jgi:hypothetical protein
MANQKSKAQEYLLEHFMGSKKMESSRKKLPVDIPDRRRGCKESSQIHEREKIRLRRLPCQNGDRQI